MDGSRVCITLGAQMSAWRPLRPPGRRHRTELPVYPVCSTRNTSKLGVLICTTVQSHAQTVCRQGLWEMSADQQPLPSCWELCPCFLQSAIHHQRQSARAAASIEFVLCTLYILRTLQVHSVTARKCAPPLSHQTLVALLVHFRCRLVCVASMYVITALYGRLCKPPGSHNLQPCSISCP